MSDPQLGVVEVAGHRLTTARWGSDTARIVMLHDGLGSISQWRDVPARIAQHTGVGVLAYDRAGHGSSTPIPDGAWPADWLHREAVVLADLLDALAITQPILVGHSDGGSIALLHGAARGACAGVVALAAHSFVEQRCVDAIEALRAQPDRVMAGLARHHDDPHAVFEAWSGVWTSDAFRSWDIRPLLATIECPTLVVQGEADEYATDDQLTTTVAAIGRAVTLCRIPGAGHVLHHSAPDEVVDLVTVFNGQL